MASYTPINQAEADTMFLFWQESGRNFSRTAKQFSKGRTSIYRYAKRFGWSAKADKIDRDKTKAVATKQIDDITMITALQQKVAKALLVRANKLDKVTVSDFALLTRLKLEIEGELPTAGTGSDTNVNVTVGPNSDGDKQRDSDIGAIFRAVRPRSRFVLNDN